MNIRFLIFLFDSGLSEIPPSRSKRTIFAALLLPFRPALPYGAPIRASRVPEVTRMLGYGFMILQMEQFIQDNIINAVTRGFAVRDGLLHCVGVDIRQCPRGRGTGCVWSFPPFFWTTRTKIMSHYPLSDLFPVTGDVVHSTMELKALHVLEGVLLLEILGGSEAAFEVLEGLVMLHRDMERRYGRLEQLLAAPVTMKQAA